MYLRSKFRAFCLVLAGGVGLSLGAAPQTTTITGTVSNGLGQPAPQPVSGAMVSYQLMGTAQIYHSTTSMDGSYSLAGLPFGHYRVTASALGFVTLELSDWLRPGANMTRYEVLRPGPPGWVLTELPNKDAIATGQNCLKWCWAAGAAMLAKSQGVNIAEEVFVDRLYPHPPGTPPPCSPAPNLQVIAATISGQYPSASGNVTIAAQAFPGLPPPQWIIESMRDGRPFIVATASHVLVANGILWSQTPMGPQIHKIRTVDPMFQWGAPLIHIFDFTSGAAIISTGANQLTGVVMFTDFHF